jgi:hypothetical protein
MPERPDPVTDRLSRFAPNGACLDRDAILFAAGRRSARIGRLWPALAGLLAVSQIVTLVLLWPRSSEVTATPPAPAVQSPPQLILPPTSSSPDILSVGSRSDVLQKEPTTTSGEFVPAGPTLTVASALRFD